MDVIDRGSARFAPTLVLALLAASPTWAQDTVQFFEGRLEVKAYSPWPERLIKGYLPVCFEITNATTEEQRIVLEAFCSTSGRQGYEASRSVTVQPGEVFASDLFAPAFSGARGGYWLSVSTADQSERIHGIAGLLDPRRKVHAIVVLSKRRSNEAMVESWNQLLKTSDYEQRGTLLPDVSLASVTHDEAPGRHEAYSSLDAVVVDTTFGPPPADVLEPVLTWARLGGTVVLAGPGARTLAQEAPAIGRWLEPRFRRDRFDELYSFGLGQVLVFDSETLFEDDLEIESLQRALERGGQVPSLYPAGRFRNQPSIPGVGDLPYRAFTVVLILFALLIGPVNFLIVKQLKKPSLLLITIPLLALVASLVILSYGIFYQGLDVKTATQTIAVLDQRDHRSASSEVRTLFAGLSPGVGLQPAPDTACFPEPAHPRYRSRALAGYRVDMGESTVLSGDFLPVRRTATQTILTERAARGRIGVMRAGGRLSVESSLGADVSFLLLRDPDGAWHRLDGELANGGRATLVPSSDADAEQYGARLSAWMRAASSMSSTAFEDGTAPFDSLDDLWNASYVAVVAENLFVDDCGIDTNELSGLHVMFGVLDPSDEGWK